MRIAILGYGQQGQAAYYYWRKGNEITVCDVNQVELPPDVTPKLGKDYLAGLSEFDLIVRSPSVHPRDITAANSPAILDKVTTVTNEFFKVCPSKNIIGVTGTKGKGTTSTLITKILQETGKTVHLGGNIGTPPLDMLKVGTQPNDWVVLELANFQLIDIKYSPHIGVCLMVVEEHLDWHPTTEEYIQSKMQMFKNQTENDVAIYYGLNDISAHITSISKGRKVPFMKHPGADVIENYVVIDGQKICHVGEVKLIGKHNWQNICAALTAVWQITQNKDAIKKVLIDFKGLEHRLELVRVLNGVSYYNDSFGTTPETAIVAVEAFDQPKVVILGGSEKGSDYRELAKTVAKSNVRTVVAIGKTGPQIADGIKKLGFDNIVNGGTSMEQIVKTAQQHAMVGDAVILSPACASFDMFKNYKDRGEQFKATVLALS